MRKVQVTSVTLYPDQMERVDVVAQARRSPRATIIRELVEMGLPTIERALDTDEFGTRDTGDAVALKAEAA